MVDAVIKSPIRMRFPKALVVSRKGLEIGSSFSRGSKFNAVERPGYGLGRVSIVRSGIFLNCSHCPMRSEGEAKG